ncbi:hypothetical protein [Pasteurella multocida]|uniref:hypothetical protein n=1 Tax=Pasteurella multocida TaxID=747 RepID=UPI00293188C1|nr:hypothetical protein [Pasteurella multocida]MEB4511238.1 hypothetical protein [Pasteurella multocida]MEB4560533.1 hypothetical protein [Pasteurella multocida]WNY73150.1 hypothetical protein H2512_06740 [Pasteurella multocida]WNY73410.1 hypothetical protein H2512_08125 [Pasteurella multocida]HDR1743708.1 hypothetical protein [Pasteurella multocida]
MGKETIKQINRNNKDLFYRYCLMFVLQAKDPATIAKALINGIDYFEVIKNSNNNDTFKAILKEHQNAGKNAEK